MNRALVTTVVACVLAAGSAVALGQGSAFTYQGQLGSNGTAVSGTVDLQFQLFNAATGGASQSSVVTVNNVSVSNGLFSTPVDFGVNPYTSGQPLWLQISVRNPATTGAWVAMTARQQITAAPYSLATRGLAVDATGNVGIGTPTPNRPLHVQGNGAVVAVERNAPDPSLSLARYFTNGSFAPAKEWKRFNISVSGTGPNVGSLNFVDDQRNVVQNGQQITRMTIDTDGRVGIGTEPIFPFLVDVGGRILLRSQSGGLSGGFEMSDSDSVATSRVFVGRGGPTERHTGVFANGLGWAMVVKDNGNVGIGRSDPLSKLHVLGPTGDANSNGIFTVQEPAGPLGMVMGVGGPPNSEYAWMQTRFINNPTVRRHLMLQPQGGVVCIGTTSPDQLLTVGGNASKPGGGQWANISDARTKTNIQPLTGTLERLLKLKGHTFEYKPEFIEAGRALPGTQIGLIAQEVEEVFPEWISTGAGGMKLVIERSTTALMVEALRDLRAEKDAQIADLAKQNQELQERLARLEELLIQGQGSTAKQALAGPASHMPGAVRTR